MKMIDRDVAMGAAQELTQYLRQRMQGSVILPHEAAYATARQIWNGAVEHQPALIVRCETSEDVQHAVQAARHHDIPLSVRGGGHDWAGRALRHDGMVIDLSGMRRVQVDVGDKIAKVEGGATAADLIKTAAPHGLAGVTGTVGSVGLAGLTLGGGYGPLIGRHGLALDNLLGAEMILADGRLVTANAVENADLFWAIRGGGGNFGIVTSMTVQLHEISEILSGLILFPWFEAESVLRAYAKFLAWAPDELMVLAGVISDPAGNPVLFLAPNWSGGRSRGEQVIAALRGLGTSIFDQVGPKTYAEMLGMFDAHVAFGRHYAIRSRLLSNLTPQFISAIVAAGSTRTSPFSAIALHHFHGAATRVPTSATAFGQRDEHFLIEIVAAWEPVGGDDGRPHRQWLQSVAETLATVGLPGGYPNMLAPDDHEQIAHAYGANTAKLLDMKRRFDPDQIFSATPMPPAAATGGLVAPDRSESASRNVSVAREAD